MKWHAFETHYDTARKSGYRISAEELYGRMNKALMAEAERGNLRAGSDANAVTCEYQWIYDRRPYYSIWPSVTESLTKVSLDIDSSHLRLPVRTLFVRTQVGHELPEGISGVLAIDCPGARCYRLASGKTADSLLAVNVNIGLGGDGVGMRFEVGLRNGVTIEEEIGELRDDPHAQVAMRILCAVALLGTDSDIVTPDVLSDDVEKYEKADSGERRRLVDKAHRRGKVGWDIGKHIEVGPHIRRPHFGIRWTEKGHSVPRMVPVKGCVVNRRAVAQVPTGYLDAPLCVSCKLRPAADGERCEECLGVATV